MAFDPKGFQVIAEWLVNQRSDEPSFRTAISRLYYAAYHIAATQCAQKLNWQPTGFGDDHRSVINHLKKGKLRSRGDELNALLELREHADYHLDASLRIGNQDSCSFCKKLRGAGKESDVVTDFHWKEAKTLADRCIPLLQKI